MLSTINIYSLYQFKFLRLDTCSQLKSNNLSLMYFISLINLVIFHIRAVENKDKGTGATPAYIYSEEHKTNDIFVLSTQIYINDSWCDYKYMLSKLKVGNVKNIAKYT